MSYEWVMWTILAMVFFMLEMIKPKWVLFWFAIGSIAAIITSIVIPQLEIANQIAMDIFYFDIIVFFGVSLILVIVARPIMKWMFRKESKPMHIEAAIGREEICIEDIDNSRKKGAIRLFGTPWNARTPQDDIKVSEGDKVRILDIDGLCLIVEPIDRNNKTVQTGT